MSIERAMGGPPGARASRSSRAPREGRRYALVIGIDAYDHGVTPLHGAAADARAVAAVLRDPRRADPYDEVLLRVNDEATLAGVTEAYLALQEKLRGARDARVLVYYAGHGIAAATPEDTELETPGYFLPQDARQGDKNTYLSMKTVEDALDALPCHHLLLILDCCFAGAFRWSGTRAVGRTPGTLYLERFERYLRDPAWHVITSSAQDERALDTIDGKVMLAGDRGWAPDATEVGEDDTQARSPFAVALVRGLRGDADFRVDDDAPPDGVITATELHFYIAGHFDRWERRIERRLQKPLLFPWPGREHSKGEFIFLNPRVPALELKRAAPLVESANPYRGFRSYRYDPGDAKVFFGREALVKALFEKVTGARPDVVDHAAVDLTRGERVVLVLGSSGSGKSSLVAAGLLPRLAAADWTPLPATIRPGPRPMEALLQAARALDPTAPGGSLAEAARRLFARDSGARRVLVIDQLEEIVTMRQGDDSKEAFFAEIDRAIEVGGGRLRVVYTLRSDFEPHFAKELVAKHPACRYRVTPLSREELRDVIEHPAEACVLQFKPPELVDEIIREVLDAPGALPLLSFTLSEMYLHYVRAFAEGRDDRVLTVEDYERLGRVEGSLGRRADAVYDALDVSTRATMRRVVVRMVSLEGGQRARRRVLRAELVYADPAEAGRVERVLTELTSARLVVGGSDEEGNEYVEPAHDKIVLGWARLREWLNAPGAEERFQAVQVLRSLLQHRSGLNPKDPRLDAWAAILKSGDSPFNAAEEALVRGALARRRAAQWVRRGAWAAVFVGVALFGGVWFVLGQRAREAGRREAVARRQAEAALDEARVKEVARHAAELRLRNEVAGFELQNLTEALTLFRGVSRWVRRPPGVEGALLEATEVALARIQLRGHSDDVLRAHFSPDGTRIVTASKDGTARIWDAREGRPGTTLRGHTGEVLDAVFSPDGTRIVTASKDGTARVWRVDGAGEPVVLRGHESEVTSAVFSPDGARVVTASTDGTARVWGVDGAGEPIVLRGHRAAVVGAAFSADGARVVTASKDGTARVWRASGEGRAVVLRGHEGEVTSAVFSPDGSRVVTASSDETAVVWRADGKGDPVVLRGHEEGLCAAAFSHDGTRVVTASSDETARVWRADGTGEAVVLRSHEGAVTSAQFSPDDTRVLTTSTDYSAHLWDARTGSPLAALEGHTKQVWAASFSPDDNGSRVVTASADGTARIWKRGGALSDAVVIPVDSLDTAALSRDGTRVVTVAEDRPARVWDTRNGALVATLQGRVTAVSEGAFSPDGARVVTASTENTAQVWDARDGRPAAPPLRGHTGEVNEAAFSPDGTRLVTASDDGSARTWDARTGALLRTFQGPPGYKVWGASFSPRDGAWVVTASEDRLARVWDARTGSLVTTFRGHSGGIVGAVFSPDGAQVVTAAEDLSARVWTVRDGRPVVRLQGHQGEVITASFSPDGALVVTTSEDETARVWDAREGSSLFTLRHSARVGAAAFLPARPSERPRVVTVSEDGAVRVWTLDSSRYTRIACDFLRDRSVGDELDASVREACGRASGAGL